MARAVRSLDESGLTEPPALQTEEEMRASLEDSYIEMTFDRFRAVRHPTLSPYLLLIDCETRRFTIERPATMESFDLWCREVEHAIAAGRHIVCVPVQDKSTADIEMLGAGLGYTLWPSRTILSPPFSKEAERAEQPVAAGDSRWRTGDEQRQRLLARVGVA
jgi:hypothetical protein